MEEETLTRAPSQQKLISILKDKKEMTLKSAQAFGISNAAVNGLIEKGFVDEDNIGVQGHSWGGYQIAYLVTKTDIFKAAESGAPVVNMISAFGGIRWDTGLSRQFQYEHTQSRIGGTPCEYPQRYF